MYKLALLLFVGVAAAQQFNCPAEDGFYRDSGQCDKYYDCYRGAKTEKLCPDGLVFDNTLGPNVEQCNYPFIVSCPEGSQLQAPQPSSIECPRMNGYFEHEDASNCGQYYECTNGLAVKRLCSPGLVFDEFTGTCQWAHAGFRSGCTLHVEVLQDGFSCPDEIQLAANGHELAHARYSKPADCRFFYVCEKTSRVPREIGCPQGTVFNDLQLICDAPANVPGCENYYADDGPLTGLSASGLDRAQG